MANKQVTPQGLLMSYCGAARAQTGLCAGCGSFLCEDVQVERSSAGVNLSAPECVPARVPERVAWCQSESVCKQLEMLHD